MEIVRINLASLEPNTGQLPGLPSNPREWTQSDIDRIAKSLKETPELFEARPLLVYPLDTPATRYIILGGNLRYEGAKKNKMKTVPCIVFPWATEFDTLKAIVIKDNGSFGSWDYDALANEWDDLPLADWGVPVWDMEQHSEDSAGGAMPPVEEDDFDENTDEIHVRCQKGDIWQLGEHRLMCGDSIDLQQVKTLMGGVRADMVFTDPPYGVAIGDKNAMLNSVQKAGRCCKNIINDTLPVDKLYDVLRQAMENVKANCEDDATYFVCAPPGGDMGLMMMMKDAGLNVRHQIVWNKNSATFSLGRLDYDYKHEAIMYTWTKSHHNYRKGPFRTSVWDIDKPRKCDLHPSMKPVELVAAALEDGSKEGDIVLDVFGGSGTTLIAAEQLGRKCYMMELDPHYCDVIIARWEKLTGQQAHKVSA